MMKKLFFLFLLSLSSSLKAQQYYTFIVFVTDNDLRPIANVQITIKECGWCSKYTGVDGKAVFEKSLSAGNIHYIVSKEGYQYQQSEYNITTEEKSNPKHIVLSAQRNQNDKFLIMGTVLDKSKNTIPSASIEVEYGGGKVSTMSDAFGFFSAEMQKNALYQSGKIINVKAAYGSCRKVEIIDFPASSVIRLNLQMECAISALTNAVNNEELLYQKVMSKL